MNDGGEPPQPPKETAEGIKVPDKGDEVMEEDKRPQYPPGPNPEAGKKVEELNESQEDKDLKERLELSVERLKDANLEVKRLALELLRKEIRESTSSMTAVPKPLKFLSPHYEGLKALYAALPGDASTRPPAGSPTSSSVSQLFADMLSVLGMTMGNVEARETLKYKLVGTVEDVGVWGHEYVRHLSGEVGAEWAGREEALEEGAPTPDFPDLLSLVRVVVPYNLTHSAEHDAVDLLMDISRLDLLLDKDVTAGVLLKEGSAAAAATAAAAAGGTATTATTTTTTSRATSGGVAVVESDGEFLQTPSSRVCSYLAKCATYAGEEDVVFSCLTTAFTLYMDHGNFTAALLIALRLGGEEKEKRIQAVWDGCCSSNSSSSSSSNSGSGGGAPATPSNAGMKRQLASILGRARVNFSTGDDALDGIIGNVGLSGSFAVLARDLDTVEAKAPEEVYKSHLSGDVRSGEERVAEVLKGARKNLADAYVSGFVNVGYGSDKLSGDTDAKWPYNNKDHGQTAAVASLGLLHLWNDSQMSVMDKYLNAKEDPVKAGALLGLGVMFAGTRNPDADAAFALLSEVLEPQSSGSGSGSGSAPAPPPSGAQRAHALLGLGLAYAGSNRSDVADLAVPYLEDAGAASSNVDVTAMAAVCIGLTFCGRGANSEPYGTLIADRLMATSPTEAGVPIMRHVALGLGLLFLGRGEEADMFVSQVLPSMGDTPLGLFARHCVHACAYAGTGNAVAIQKLLRVCAEHPEMEEKEKAREVAAAAAAAAGGGGGGGGAGGEGGGGGGGGGASAGVAVSGLGAAAAAAAAAAPAEKPVDRKGTDVSGKFLHQSLAVLGLGLVSAGEDLSGDMAGRMADHLLQYGDAAVRRAVPLALAVVHLSDPDYATVDLLSKLSHDHNEDCAQSAILALGLVGAGTNNSRIAGLLRTLSVFYKAEADTLFVTRIAQGLLHMGKGLVTISPFYSDRSLCCGPALAGLLVFLVGALDTKGTLHQKWHTLLFGIASAITPRSLTMVDESGAPCKLDVRVGAAVDTVAQAGRPKSITGFQTHTTPVLLGVKDRAELVDDTYTALTGVLEGVVVVRKNPASRKKDEKERVEKERKLKLAAGGGGGRSDLAWG